MAALQAAANILFFGIIISRDVAYAKETVVPEICNARIEATHTGKVANIFWTGCNSDDCKTTFIATFKNKSFVPAGSFSHASRGYHPYTPDNTWQVECFYDYTLVPEDGSKNTPCKYQESKLKEAVDMTKYTTISVSIRTCINQTCSRIKEYEFLNPARNPCYSINPCKNNAKCNPGLDTYNCTCAPEWVGTNCTVSLPPGYNYTAGKCLDYNAKINKATFVSSAKECGNLCAAMNESKSLCKSFEIRYVPSSNQKKCILHDSNSLTHRLVSCDGDYFEASAFNSRPKASASNSAAFSYFLLLIYVAWVTLN